MPYVRVAMLRSDPAKWEQIRRFGEERVTPTVRQLPGFRRYIAAGDPASGRGLTISEWDTREQAQRALAEAAGVAQEIADLSVKAETVYVYEVVTQAWSTHRRDRRPPTRRAKVPAPCSGVPLWTMTLARSWPLRRAQAHRAVWFGGRRAARHRPGRSIARAPRSDATRSPDRQNIGSRTVASARPRLAKDPDVGFSRESGQ